MTTPKSAAKGIAVSLLCGALLAFLASLLYVWLTGAALEDMLLPIGVMLVAGIVVSAIVGLIMARNANRVFGMVNGDILGATNEVCRPLVTLAMGIAFVLVI